MGRPKKSTLEKRLKGTDYKHRREGANDPPPVRKLPESEPSQPYEKTLNEYVDGVLSGKIVTGRLIYLAAERFVSDLSRQGHDDFPYTFDIERANEHMGFFEMCRHWKGEKARYQIRLEPHQVFQFANLYGWHNVDSDVRRFHRAIKLVARKNYKTTEAAMMALDHLHLNPPAGPQVFAGSMKHDQSIIVVNDAGMIAQNTPEIADEFEAFKYRGQIQRLVNWASSGFFAPLSKEGGSSTQDGLDPSFGIIDEYHAHPDDRVVNILESAFGNRPNWFEFIISTAGANKYGPCFSVSRKTGINILKGIQSDDQLFLMFHELDDDDDWEDEQVWIKANPRMATDQAFIEYMRSRFKIAKNQHGEKESDFKTKNLNLWVDQYNAWFPDELWMQQTPGRMMEDLDGKECFGGLDLAATRDFNALSLVFPRGEDFFDVLMYFWIPTDTLNNRIDKVSDFFQWKNKYIRQTPGQSVDYQVIINDIRELTKRYNIKSIAYDRKYAAPIVTSLESDVAMTPFDQGIGNISYPTKKLEILVGHRKINHYENPVLRWMVQNVAIYRDANDNIKVIKNKSADNVDGVVALIMALGEHETGTAQGESVYAKRGVITI